MDVRVDLELLRGARNERLTIPLFDGEVVEAVREQQEEIPDGGFTWTGHITGEPMSSVVLAAKGESLVGTIRTQGGGLYRIQPSRAGHQLQELDPAGFPPESEADEPPPGPITLVSPPCGDDPNTIDVLVVYTESARKGADPTGIGGSVPIEAAIYLSMAETNQSYVRSDVAHRLRLVHVQEVDYEESDDSFADRNRLVNPNDGELDDVPVLRDAYGADVVVLLVEKLSNPDLDKTPSSGRAYIMNNQASYEKYAYAVVKRSCATTGYSFGHEIGHLMSARHDWIEDSTNNSPFAFNHGHLNTSPSVTGVGPWRTIMSYNGSCLEKASVDCIRINYWSNPGLRYPPAGDPLGDDSTKPQPTDNHKALNLTAPVVANFRCETPSPRGTKVWMKDAWSDSGLEPDPGTAGLPMWQSPYIWVRRAQDPTRMNQHLHQMPLAGRTNWIYVKLHNSEQTSTSGNLEIWWADASTSLTWPIDWSLAGTVPISGFAGESTMIAELPWQTAGTGHYCLLARWVSALDTMAVAEGSDVNANVRNNNNLIWKNVNVIEGLATIVEAHLMLRNRLSVESPATLRIGAPSHDRRPSFLAHGAVDIRLDPRISSAWRLAGSHGSGFTGDGERLGIGSEGANLEDIRLPAGYEGRVHLRFHRLPTTLAGTFVLDVVQLEGDTVVGGVTYEINTEETETQGEQRAGEGRPAGRVD